MAVPKQFIVVAGPNGSGKTTFAEEYLAQHAFAYLSADSIAAARQRGFTSTIVMLFLDSPEGCVARVRQRVRNGGHDVPEVEVRRRFYRSLRNFWTHYRFLADDWGLVYNAGDDFQDAAIGAVERISVRDEKLFGQFVALAGSST